MAITFWIVAGALLAVCVATLAGALRATSRAPASPDMDVYRDQLAELDRDAARGTLAPSEAEAARTEVARRLLAADGIRPAARVGGRRGLGLALVVGLVPGLALGVYLLLGQPAYPDLPARDRIARIEAARAARPLQEAAERQVADAIDDSRPDVTEMTARLEEVLAERPDDLAGWKLAVRTQAGLNDLEAAWRSQDRVIAIEGDAATAEDYALLAELMILAAGDYVSPEAERALDAAIRRDPASGSARYYAGLMYAQGGRPDRAWTIWRNLLADSPPDAPWQAAIRAQAPRVSALAGDPTAPEDLPVPRGPTMADIDAATDLAPEERTEMVRGMVDGLAARLADQGGPPADWARLVSAYGVLGQTDAAAEVYAEARTVFADDADALAALSRAAASAGIAP